MPISDALRAELQGDLLKLSPNDRLALAFRLGDEDLQLLCASRGLTPDAAHEVFRRAKSAGRRPSVVNEPVRP